MGSEDESAGVSPADAEDRLDTRSPVFVGLVRGMLPMYLLILLSERPLHGTEIIRSIAEMSGGRWKPSPGSVYPLLRRLEGDGLITGDWRRGTAAAKRVYRLTDAGRDELPAMRRRVLSDLRAARVTIEQHIAALEQIERGGDHGHG